MVSETTIIWGSKATTTGPNALRYLGLGFHANRSGATNRFSSTYRVARASGRVSEIYLTWQPRQSAEGAQVTFGLLRVRDGNESEVFAQSVSVRPSDEPRAAFRGLAIDVKAGDELIAFLRNGPTSLGSSPFYLSTQAVIR